MDEANGEPKLSELDYFFEGAEKLLEVWFLPAAGDVAAVGSLRSIPREALTNLLESASCHILQCRSNAQLDSYLLSESSMFISDRRFILKTCGCIRLLDTVERIIKLAATYASLKVVGNVYYSRRNFLRPEMQPEFYRQFEEEVAKLDTQFTGKFTERARSEKCPSPPSGHSDGGAYCMGSLKGDRWYLYTMNSPFPNNKPDHTMEILMSEVPKEILQIFTLAENKTTEECTLRSGIPNLCPKNTEIHAELFDPCGYSMNGLVGGSDQYVTVHVTPEERFSYISFETNQNVEDLYEMMIKVLSCFRPNKFMLNLFSNNLSSNGVRAQRLIWKNEVRGYVRRNIQFLRLPYDTLVYAQFTCGE